MVGIFADADLHETHKAFRRRTPAICYNRLLVGNFALALLIRSQKPFAVEMDEVGRCLRNPYLRFPRDVRKVLCHGSTGKKRGHEYQPSPSCSENGFQLVVALESNRTMTRDRFNQDKPVLLRKVNDHVGHFSG